VPARIRPLDRNGGVLGLAAQNGGLEPAQPGADFQAHGLKFATPNVDMGAFFQDEGKRRDAVIQHCTLHLETSFAEQHATLTSGSCLALARETCSAAKASRDQSAVFVELRDAEHRVVVHAADQIPGVGFELVLDGLDHSRPTVDAHRFLTAVKTAQQLVEADEMVDVPVADEHITDAQQLARRQGRKIADVEQQCPALK
jgi:hypothetical protein